MPETSSAVALCGRKPRLALFLPSLVAGGAESVMLTLANGFTERGLDVDLVLARGEGPLLSQVSPLVRVVDLRAGRVLTSLPGLVRYLRRERPQALLSTLGHANIIALIAGRLCCLTMRVVIREATTPSAANSHLPRLSSHFYPLLVRRFYPCSAAVVAVSHGVAEDLIGTYGLPRERIHVIYNPVNIHEVQSKAEEPADHPWFAAGKPPVLLGVGRLTAAKDYVTLIRAFSLVRQQRNVRLVIAGEGEERSRLEALIRELGLAADVDLPGFIRNPISLMARARIFILSSNREGLPNALIQAMFVGTPLISTDCLSGPREILQGVQNSCLVPVGNANTLAEAIFSFLDNDITATTPPAAGRFASETVINSYLQLLMGGEGNG